MHALGAAACGRRAAGFWPSSLCLEVLHKVLVESDGDADLHRPPASSRKAGRDPRRLTFSLPSSYSFLIVPSLRLAPGTGFCFKNPRDILRICLFNIRKVRASPSR